MKGGEVQRPLSTTTIRLPFSKWRNSGTTSSKSKREGKKKRRKGEKGFEHKGRWFKRSLTITFLKVFRA